MSNSPLIFRFCNCVFVFQHSNVSHLMLEIKYFVSLKNVSFLFWTRVHFKEGKLSSPKFWGRVAHKGWVRGRWRSGRFIIFFVGEGWGLSKKWWSQYFRVWLIPWRTLCLVSWRYRSSYKSLGGYWSNCKSLDADTLSSVKLTEKKSTLHMFLKLAPFKKKSSGNNILLSIFICVFLLPIFVAVLSVSYNF